MRGDPPVKIVKLIIRQAEVSKEFPEGMRLSLKDDASIIDALNAADQLIKEKCGRFSMKGYTSLLQMVYHPSEDRFYNQVAVQGYTKSNTFLNIRENPRKTLPNETTIILVPEGGCATDWEEPVK
jgi:hypothetical protein